LLAACTSLYEYHKKIAEGKYTLTTKLVQLGVIRSPEEIKFGFFLPMSPSGFHVSLKPPDPAKLNGVVGQDVSVKVDKVCVGALTSRECEEMNDDE
jgi:hypothetical protein